MEVETRTPQQLTAAELADWRELVAGHPHYFSPFFSPDYVLAISEFRPQVEVAVIRAQGAVVGWLPFERHNRTVAHPLGIKLADFQGAILRPGVVAPLDELTSRLGLSVLHYDHLLAGQAPRPGVLEIADSPYLDLSDGYENFITRQRASGPGLIAQTQRKQKKLLRDKLNVTFTWNDPDPEALLRLWEWKAVQRKYTRTMDILKFDWVRNFLQRIARTDQNGLHGVVSTLRINGQLAAVHLGMHSDRTFHYWFPAYSFDWAAYSPGLILLLRVAEECARRGINRIDLGKGDDRYKAAFASGATPVAAGAIDRNRVRQFLRVSLYHTKNWVKHSPLRAAAKIPSRLWQQWRARTRMGES